MRNAECGMGGTGAPLCGNPLADKPAADAIGRNVKRLCAGIPCGQTRRRCNWPKREAPPARPAGSPRNRMPLCAGTVSPTAARLPVGRGTERSCARPAFRRAACAGIPSRQTRRRHGWPKREATLVRGRCLADRRAPAGSPRNRALLRAACLSPRSCAVHRKTEPCCSARIFRRKNRLSRARKRGCCGRFVGKSDDRSVSPRYL